MFKLNDILSSVVATHTSLNIFKMHAFHIFSRIWHKQHTWTLKLFYNIETCSSDRQYTFYSKPIHIQEAEGSKI